MCGDGSWRLPTRSHVPDPYHFAVHVTIWCLKEFK